MNQRPMDTLIELAREARDQAALLLADERRSGRELMRQVELLETYRQEYGLRLHAMMDRGIDLASLRNYQGFLRSLDAAVSRARDSLEQSQDRVMNRSRQWQQEQRRLSSYDTLAERRRLLDARQEQRRELRHSDEINTNSFTRARLREASDQE